MTTEATKARRHQFPVTIIRAARGTERREVNTEEIQIPDLWHIATALRESKIEGLRAGADAVLETWHLCHDLLDNIRNPEL